MNDSTTFSTLASPHLWRLLLAAFAGLLTASCKKEQAQAPPPPTIEVAEVIATNAPMNTEIIGQLDSPQNVDVRARVEAFVEKVLFTEGEPVKEGEVLFKLDPKPFQERLAAANAMLAEAEAALNKYLKDVDRLEPLATKRAIPQQDLDNARASVDVGRASVLSAKAHVDSAKLDLGYCDVLAPISGLIGAKQVSMGALVGKGEPTLLATISSLDPIWFYCAISEAQYLRAEAKVRATGRQIAELPVTLILADGSVHPDKGKFVFIDRAVDIKTGTLRVRAEFANGMKILRPGMFGRIRVDLGVRPESIVVPERAVTELQGKSFVWIIGPENKATQRAVTLGESVNGGVLIAEGLKAGERIVIEGQQKLREDTVVTPMTAEQIAAQAAEPTAGSGHPAGAAKAGKE